MPFAVYAKKIQLIQSNTRQTVQHVSMDYKDASTNFESSPKRIQKSPFVVTQIPQPRRQIRRNLKNLYDSALSIPQQTPQQRGSIFPAFNVK